MHLPQNPYQSLVRIAAIVSCTAPLIAHSASSQDQTPTRTPAPEFLFDVGLQPADHVARVTVQLHDVSQQVRSMAFAIDPQRYKDLRASGELRKQGTVVLWLPPREHAQLTYKVSIDHLRTSRVQANNKRFDARLTDRWAILRGDDLIPPAKVRMKKGTAPLSTLHLALPPGWHAALPYARNPDGTYSIDNPHRKFDRPSGWFALGHLNIKRERIAGTKVTIASPVDAGFRSMDVLALARWTLPTYERILGHLPERLLIAGVNEPMWRGGLSGPASVYLHASLPLVAHDGTSPFLHELTHTLLRARSGPGGDWINEGLAELYSLEILKRSGTLSERRYKKALAHLRQSSQGVKTLEADSAHGAVTARAVTVLHKLDVHLRRKSQNQISLDDIVRAMVSSPTAWTTLKFRELSEQVGKLPLRKFFAKYITATNAHWTP